MQIKIISASQLTNEQIARWSLFQQADPVLHSPYFHPEFTLAVASVRNDVETAVLYENGRTVGFFPFQRGKGDVGLPVGGKMSDFQGVIVESGFEWSPEELLHGCGLSAWRFDHLIASQKPFQPYHWRLAGSPYLDLSAGWKGYEARQLREHSSSFKRNMRKFRQAERESHKIRFEYHTDSSPLFATLVEWKQKQYRETGVTDVLSFAWTEKLLREVLTRDGEGFAGVLSALYIDDVLAAVLLSMKSYEVLHAWFSAYGPEFAQYSPGLMLWIELAKAAESEGIRRIDLGKGPETYKKHFMSDSIPLAEGSIDTRPIARMLNRQWNNAYHWLRSSSLKKPLLAPGRFIRRMLERKGMK
jgi:CelD/BcsL family acetyltransferase involved in cellulose biosynthesis